MNGENDTIDLNDEKITTSIEQMDNGDTKVKMTASDGSYYCRTAASSHGGWQNSHVHVNVTEFYVVQSGWIAYASLGEKQLPTIEIMKEGELVVVEPGTKHNIYMSAHSVIHTIKHGPETYSDWIASPELDQLTKSLTQEDILRRSIDKQPGVQNTQKR